MSGLLLRSARSADLAEIIHLERASAEASHWTETEYASILNGSAENTARRCFLVSEVEECLVGFAIGRVVISGVDGFSELESVVVDAGCRRRGFGRALCAAVIAWSRALGAGEMQLEVRAGSFGAIALYEDLGFAAVGRRGEYYRTPVEDAVLMRLDLTAPGSRATSSE